MNLLPRLQRRGTGTKLLAAWLEAAAGRGVDAVHIGVNRANEGGVAFWRRQGFAEIETARALPGRTLWLGRRSRV
jgi:ribosomal protein S18 acetylase RimI-like enzyme